MKKWPWILGLILAVSVIVESINAIMDGAGNGLIVFRLIASVIGIIVFVMNLLKKREAPES
jgi:hypothetical protein